MRGHVRERGRGNWYAVLSMHDPQTSKRRVKFVSLPNCKGKREAQEKCAEIIRAMRSDTYIEPDKTTLGQFLERWLEHIRTQVTPGTFERYSEIVHRNLIPGLGAFKLAKLRPDQISTYYSEALASGRKDGTGGLSARTVGHLHRVLKQALKQAVLWQALPRNPAGAVKPPKVPPKEMSTIDAAETADMIEVARGAGLLIPILLGVACGLRRGEVVALRWRSVDLDKGQLSVVAAAEQTNHGTREKGPKSGKGRNVALPAMVVTELRRYRLQQAEWLLRLGERLSNDHHVVTRENGEPIPPRSLTRLFGKFRQRHKLPEVRFHDLRHSHATQMLAGNIHPKIVSERLGHSKVGITLDTYSHVLPGMQEAAAESINTALQEAIDRKRK
jgi:integrase